MKPYVSSYPATDIPQWYAVHTNSRQEVRADSNLRAWGIKTFSPLLKERTYSQLTGKGSYVVKSLFPRYIFAQFVARDLLYKVCFTRGVHSVVSFGDQPSPVDDEIIAYIQMRVGGDGFVRMDDDLRSGDRVMIKEGPLKNLTGIFHQNVKDGRRVMILLSAVSYQSNIVVERTAVRKIA